MEEKYTKLGQDLEKFELPVDEKEWKVIASDPAVVRYGRLRFLRRISIYGSAALLVAAVVTTVVLLNRPDKARIEAQKELQKNVNQNVQNPNAVAEYTQKTAEVLPETDAKTAPLVADAAKVQGSTAIENAVVTQKLSVPVSEKPILTQSVPQSTSKPEMKMAKPEPVTNNHAKSISSASSSDAEENSFSEKNEKYSEPEPEDDFKMYIPTAFTPNGDGLNDLFTISANFVPAQFECTIFSRRGERVFYSKSMDNPWDGTKNGSVMPQNVYVYMIKYVDPNGKPCVEKGQVTLLLN